MLNESDLLKYVVDFFHNGNSRATPKDSLCLKADNDLDAIAEAGWLARHTYCHRYQVRALRKGVHTVIHNAPALARVA